MLLDLAIFAAGVILLVVGAWLLVSGGSRIASLLGVAPVVVGLTVVACGTSAPELFVSLMAALRGSSGLMLGNVVGSNVANIGLILGAAATFSPVTVESALLRREIPLLLAVSLVFTFIALDGRLGRWEGLLLTVLFGLFMWVTLRDARRGRLPATLARDAGAGGGSDPGDGARAASVPGPTGDSGAAAPSAEPLVPGLPWHTPRVRSAALAVYGAMVVVGIGGLTGGGHLIVESGLSLARRFGVSDALIGLSLVAVGTSLPELATTVVAAARRESDIALGNVIGSNLFNILAVAGPVALVSPLRMASEVRAPQLVSMLVLTGLLAVLVRGRPAVSRGAGILLLVLYAVTMVWWTRLGT